MKMYYLVNDSKTTWHFIMTNCKTIKLRAPLYHTYRKIYISRRLNNKNTNELIENRWVFVWSQNGEKIILRLKEL